MREWFLKSGGWLMPLGGVVIVGIIGVIAYFALMGSDVGHALEGDSSMGIHE
ncbi:MAG: hypothetical protein RLZZ283_402 [Candidatus Parcubacteria bacterium]|jgi:hypothetical protein